MKIAIATMSAVMLAVSSAAAWHANAADAPAAQPERPKVTVLADESVSGNDKMHAVIVSVEWPVGGVSIKHYHAGDEYATVLEGAVEIDNEGEAPHIYKAGEAYHNKRGVVHVARNASPGISRLSAVLIVDKGTPLQVPTK